MGITYDLLVSCRLLREHVACGKVGFGINHEFRDFQHDRRKSLDLVLCTPGTGQPIGRQDLVQLIERYRVLLSEEEACILAELPRLAQMPVGSVLLALECKACMTAHQRALPRLYDELNSSHQTVHGATDQAIAAGFVIVNIADRYLSPDLNKLNVHAEPNWSRHSQPRDASLVVDKVRQIPRRTKTGQPGFDAMAVVLLSCRNDGSPIELVERPPAPTHGDIYHYASMIERVNHIYSTRFGEI